MTGGPDPLKNHKNIGFLSNTGLDLLKFSKILKAMKPAFNVDHNMHADIIRADIGPLLVVFGSALPV